nr:hypothetical protein [Tanacetum cinerariifolium]
MHNSGYAFFPIKSTQMASKILEHLERTTPKEKPSSSRLARTIEKSAMKLTSNLALGSLDKVESSKFLLSSHNNQKSEAPVQGNAPTTNAASTLTLSAEPPQKKPAFRMSAPEEIVPMHISSKLQIADLLTKGLTAHQLHFMIGFLTKYVMMGPLTLAIQPSDYLLNERMHIFGVVGCILCLFGMSIQDKAPIAAFDFHSIRDDVIAVGAKERKETVGERIAALQHLVSPYNKVMLFKIKEEDDKTIDQAFHTIFKGIHDKGTDGAMVPAGEPPSVSSTTMNIKVLNLYGLSGGNSRLDGYMAESSCEDDLVDDSRLIVELSLVRMILMMMVENVFVNCWFQVKKNHI